jgi:ATP-dependent Clp protease ATP-binding subunit ClpB
LRGLKERYEVHHGVRIQDAALVAQRTLSHRYITDRFLPTKAVDLIDEAASGCAWNWIPCPRKSISWSGKSCSLRSSKALSKRKRTSFARALEKIEKQLAELKEQSSKLKAQWQNEKAAINAASIVNSQLEQAKTELEKAQRAGDLNLAAQIQYGKIPELQGKLAAAEKASKELPAGKRLLSQEVTEEDIAQSRASWTGIPVTKMLEGERQKLVKMEERLSERVVGQQEAIHAVANAVRRARSGLQDPNRPIGSSSSLVQPASEKRNWRARWRSSYSMTKTRWSDRHERIHGEAHVARLIGAPPGYVGLRGRRATQ